MNERIRELQKQSSIEQWDYDNGCYRYILNPEKFAELIIRECGIVGDDWVDNEDNGKNRISDKFRQHFGVKEL